jgi:hypothetical protein
MRPRAGQRSALDCRVASKAGSAIFGLKYTDDHRLKLVSFNPRQIGHPGRELADLGPAIRVNNQVRGLTASADARTIATVAGLRLLPHRATHPRPVVAKIRPVPPIDGVDRVVDGRVHGRHGS